VGPFVAIAFLDGLRLAVRLRSNAMTAALAAMILPVLSVFFSLLGLNYVFLVMRRPFLRDEGGAIRFGYLWAGRFIGRTRFPKGELRDIRLKPAAAAPRPGDNFVDAQPRDSERELLIRSRDSLVRVGRGMGREELEWLRDVCYSWL
jgi:hypothetical protein